MMVPRTGRSAVSDIFELIGLDCFGKDELIDARMMFEMAVEQGIRDNDPPEFMVSKFHNLAVVCFHLSEYKHAETRFQQALQCFVENPEIESAKLECLLANYAELMEERHEQVLADAFKVCAEMIGWHWRPDFDQIDDSELMNVA